MCDEATPVSLLDFEPATAKFFEEVVAGLSADEKSLPCKYFYDRRGSALFERICQLEEYYVTRSELEIMQRFAPQMAAQIGSGAMLVEYGSGSSLKTRLLLDQLEDPVAYVPVDISRGHLQQTAEELAAIYRHIEVLPVCADFASNFDLPIPDRKPARCAVFFPGSTIGNFQPPKVARLLERIAELCGTGGGLLIGIDLKKDVKKIEAAYNDSQGVTADFNLNLLTRINRELDADFQVDQFRHRAIYNQQHGRIEMHLVSGKEQVVSIGAQKFEFAEDESICTEFSHKYTIDEFAAIAADVGLTLRRQWTDEQRNFATLHFAMLG